MDMSKLPVVAAIANYNMATELSTLLPQLVGQGYQDIFVLDDASTDNSRETVEAWSPAVQLVAGSVNIGAGGNRNRIIGALKYHALIHFLDADTVLETIHTADIVRAVVPGEPFGFVGGLAKTPEGNQCAWNYGPRQSLYGDIGATIQARIEQLPPTNTQKAERLYQRYAHVLADWPNLLEAPKRRPIFWTIEQNFVVDSLIFAKLGGFDVRFREHEIQDLAMRMHHAGLPRYFDPRLAIRHTKGTVRQYNRQLAQWAAELYIARKHGLRNWLLPGGTFKPTL